MNAFVVSGLVKRRAELAGEITRHEGKQYVYVGKAGSGFKGAARSRCANSLNC
jgi:hypothetical protein